MNDPSAEIAIFTDGAASPNPGPGGYGVVLIREGQRRELSGGFRRTTNNRMEILAAIMGLRQVQGSHGQVVLYSDSRYVVDMFNGGHAARWRQHRWTRNQGRDVALNPDLWNDLLNLTARQQVKLVWVRGHTDNQENVRCDELAVRARQAANLPPDEGYENPVVPGSLGQLTLFDTL